MYCANCGKELPDDANFCLLCGVPQRTGAVSPAKSSAEVELFSGPTWIVTNRRIKRRAGGKQVLLGDIASIGDDSAWLEHRLYLKLRNGSSEPLYCKNKDEVRRVYQAVTQALDL